MSGNRIAAALPDAFLLLLAAICAGGLWRVVAILGLHVPLDPNEGWNACLAQAAMRGAPLYPVPPSYLVNNYPPLSFYIVGLLGRLTGDMIVAGRMISLLSFFTVAAAIARIAHIMGCKPRDCAIAALLFMAWLLAGSDYVGMDDPQMLGHALGMAGLVLAIRAPRAVIAAALLLVLAGFVKHNLIALPLALAIWLYHYDRRAAWRFVIAGAAFALTGLIAFRLAYGSSLFVHLASSRVYAISRLAQGAQSWLLLGAVPLAVVTMLVFRFRADRNVMFCGVYTAIALALALIFAGGAGVDANVFFDTDIALALGSALALERFANRGPLAQAVIVAGMVPTVIAAIAFAAPPDWPERDFWLHPMQQSGQVAQADTAFLARHRGRAMCEELALCFWAGKPAEVDMFNTGQQYLTGARSDGDLVRQVEAGAFAVVQIDTLDPFALGPRVRAALLHRYRIHHTDDDGMFLERR